MEDKIKELIDAAVNAGAEIKVINIDSKKKDEEVVELQTLLRFEVKMNDSDIEIRGSLGKMPMEFIENISTLTSDDVISIFEPVSKALDECVIVLKKELEAKRRSASEVMERIAELLEEIKNVN